MGLAVGPPLRQNASVGILLRHTRCNEANSGAHTSVASAVSSRMCQLVLNAPADIVAHSTARCHITPVRSRGAHAPPFTTPAPVHAVTVGCAIVQRFARHALQCPGGPPLLQKQPRLRTPRHRVPHRQSLPLAPLVVDLLLLMLLVEVLSVILCPAERSQPHQLLCRSQLLAPIVVALLLPMQLAGVLSLIQRLGDHHQSRKTLCQVLPRASRQRCIAGHCLGGREAHLQDQEQRQRQVCQLQLPPQPRRPLPRR